MLKIDRIISVSSEDDAWPADNLLKTDGKNKKWKCKIAGEKNATIVLQIEKASKIKSIDVGNENSAFIEILVGKSCLPDDNYKVLLVASSLMTLKEAKDLSNSNGVRFFKESNFCKPEVNEKWDRIKIVCSQPYNKHVQCGLSFISFHGESEQATLSGQSKVGTLGNFILKEEIVDEIAPGSIFARRKELQEENGKTSAAAIRAASSELNKDNQSETSSSTLINRLSNKIERKGKNNKRFDSMTDPCDTPERKKIKKDPPTKNDSGSANINGPKTPNTKKTPSKNVTEKKTFKKKTCKPFNELLRGVVFTISGFQNPTRGEIRNKGLAMGAKYKPDWDPTCTHLVCAFPNTPKFNQVRGKGKIVKKEWIEESYSKRIRYPWRRFGLDPPDTQQAESEEEIYEGNENTMVTANDTSTLSMTTNRIQAPTQGTSAQDQPGPSLFGNIPKTTPKKRNSPKIKDLTVPTKKSPRKSPIAKKTQLVRPKDESDDDAKDVRMDGNGKSEWDSPSESVSRTRYLDLDLEEVECEVSNVGDWNKPKAWGDLAETESDPDWADSVDQSCYSLPHLPEQFSDLSFFIDDDFPPNVIADIKRYLMAHSGSVLEKCSQDTEYVISDKITTVKELKEKYPQIVGVRAEWVWRCHDENRLLPTSNFEL